MGDGGEAGAETILLSDSPQQCGRGGGLCLQPPALALACFLQTPWAQSRAQGALFPVWFQGSLGNTGVVVAWKRLLRTIAEPWCRAQAGRGGLGQTHTCWAGFSSSSTYGPQTRQEYPLSTEPEHHCV